MSLQYLTRPTPHAHTYHPHGWNLPWEPERPTPSIHWRPGRHRASAVSVRLVAHPAIQDPDGTHTPQPTSPLIVSCSPCQPRPANPSGGPCRQTKAAPPPPSHWTKLCPNGQYLTREGSPEFEVVRGEDGVERLMLRGEDVDRGVIVERDSLPCGMVER
ncbi:uncharacterized protein VTP21DRAFT_4433 [Calcarisporiella thermophila]|uniref:uncharacterized protein n=1 Tax=Calcarisporiella thermophila TaxID=911321 RepID=UPI0037435779